MTTRGPAAARRTARMTRHARREQLLDAARAEFVAKGYHATAMDDIAVRAGVSKPVLYQHFPGKLELYLALLEQHSDELEQRVRAAMRETTNNRKRVRGAIAAYFDFVAGEGKAFRLVLESDLRSDPTVRERVERTTLVCLEAVAGVIAEDTGVGDEEARLLAVGLVGMAETSARYWLSRSESLPRDEAVRLLSALAWRGISGFPRQNGETATHSGT